VNLKKFRTFLIEKKEQEIEIKFFVSFFVSKKKKIKGGGFRDNWGNFFKEKGGYKIAKK